MLHLPVQVTRPFQSPKMPCVLGSKVPIPFFSTCSIAHFPTFDTTNPSPTIDHSTLERVQSNDHPSAICQPVPTFLLATSHRASDLRSQTTKTQPKHKSNHHVPVTMISSAPLGYPHPTSRRPICRPKQQKSRTKVSSPKSATIQPSPRYTRVDMVSAV